MILHYIAIIYNEATLSTEKVNKWLKTVDKYKKYVDKVLKIIKLKKIKNIYTLKKLNICRKSTCEYVYKYVDKYF